MQSEQFYNWSFHGVHLENDPEENSAVGILDSYLKHNRASQGIINL